MLLTWWFFNSGSWLLLTSVGITKPDCLQSRQNKRWKLIRTIFAWNWNLFTTIPRKKILYDFHFFRKSCYGASTCLKVSSIPINLDSWANKNSGGGGFSTRKNRNRILLVTPHLINAFLHGDKALIRCEQNHKHHDDALDLPWTVYSFVPSRLCCLLCLLLALYGPESLCPYDSGSISGRD